MRKNVLAELLKQAAPQVRKPCSPGECCPHCGARLERGDDGKCNRCGKSWPEKTAVEAARQAVHEVTGHLLPEQPPASPLERLLAAKRHSDQKQYGEKHRLLRDLLRQRPGEFVIDSADGGVVGITHLPTRFHIHLPRTALPELPPLNLAGAAAG